jgi:CBS domain-containing protein
VERVNAREAMERRPSVGQAAYTPAETDDAVILRVRGGEVAARVAVGTADEAVLGSAREIRGVVRLENEWVLTFHLRAGASDTAFRDEAAHLHEPDGPLPEELGVPTGSLVAGDIMSRDVVTASADMLVEDVAKLLAFHNISGMPVEDWDGTVIGVVSEVDVVDKVGDTIGDVMTHSVISVSESTRIEQIAALMADRKIRRVPVLVNDRLVGLVTRADIVRALAARAGAPA